MSAKKVKWGVILTGLVLSFYFGIESIVIRFAVLPICEGWGWANGASTHLYNVPCTGGEKTSLWALAMAFTFLAAALIAAIWEN
jgi:hypothetical protein